MATARLLFHSSYLCRPLTRQLDKCIFNHGGRYMSSLSVDNKENHLLRHLESRIKASGPLTVAEYMKEVLTNPVSGYYMNRDVFGAKGDFITSPEISQMFGELIGIWCVNEWIQGGSEGELQVVELGPGRGTLADDMCRVFSRFSQLKSKVSLHLVEVSPTLSGIQAAKISGEKNQDEVKLELSGTPHYYTTKSKYGQPVFWYQSLLDVPKAKMCYIAHEFFDALPIHKFQKTEKGWQEILVDLAHGRNADNKLCFVLAGGKTAGLSFLQPDSNDKRDHIEVCPEAGVIVQDLSLRVKEYGGGILIGDYGHDGDKTDTFRGFKNHELHDVLVEPGTADITADVDFSYLKRMVQPVGVITHGPKEQGKFLHNMGIGIRLQALLQNANAGEWKDMLSGYDMLVNPKKMGERFKFLGITSDDKKNYTPAGFENIPEPDNSDKNNVS
ncbi:protein arginine methyltransferase NDUFAF7, mitochondrial [Patella vulgata]|uniref:protein arginine methyltransferase NDUFAF7, mitochondrial n=1 Tax=Patella vulgata TaxID=6465 RepID=UPI0024A9126B|nr:protein arginine methyltransferase NDUFAF7, mitochondrial [Patella vulgata]